MFVLLGVQRLFGLGLRSFASWGAIATTAAGSSATEAAAAKLFDVELSALEGGKFIELIFR